VKQQARVIDIVGPRTERAEVGQHIPNRLRLDRYCPGTADLGHHSIKHHWVHEYLS
jgi:hypothetical protein